MHQFYSQYGQDKYIYEKFFANKSNGCYVDIGAYDGIRLSNSYFFDQLGWRGYCFEPLPKIYEKLIVNRPNALNYNYALGNNCKIVNFLEISGEPDMLSGVLDYYNSEHMFRINKEIYDTKGEQNCISVKMTTLNEIVPLNTQIDYLSLDTEGGEFLILENILQNFKPTVISVEVNYPQEVKKLHDLIKNDYNIIQQLGCDLILRLK